MPLEGTLMEELPKKPDYRSAYEAGKKEVESRRRPFSLARTIGLAAVLILTLESTHRLAAPFKLSGFDKTLLEWLAYFIVFSVYFLWLWGPIKRNKT
jgi:hypothetical protein